MSNIKIDIEPAYSLCYISCAVKSCDIKKSQSDNLIEENNKITIPEKNIVNTIAKNLSDGYIVLWQHHGVFAGEIINGEINWTNKEVIENDKDHIVRIRAFNPTTEYHIWRSGKDLKGRKRIDEGEPVDEQNAKEGMTPFVKAEMVLRSIVTQQLNSYSKIVTRNYINHFDENNFQAGYVDSRFVKFI